MGVAIAAGQAEGIDVWKFNCTEETEYFIGKGFDSFSPVITETGNKTILEFILSLHLLKCYLTRIIISERNSRHGKWKMAVQRSLGWATSKKRAFMTGKIMSTEHKNCK